MHKKPHKVHDFPYLGNQGSSFSTLLDVIDPCPEREAQRKEYLKRQKKDIYKAQAKKSVKLRKSKGKSKTMSFEEKLERTNQWLQETFPDLFDPSQPCKALDVHIVRDIKAYYKHEHLKKQYPDDLVIKAALYRYMESPGYLACLVQGAPRYNIKSEVVGFF